jgi:hypothetical protein
MTKPPIAYIIAVLASGSIMPFAMLLDAMRVPGGDGLQGFWEMVLFLIVAIIVTIVAVIIGKRRNERFSWLILLALALWVVPIPILMI